MSIRLRIDRDRQRSEVVERSIAVPRCNAAPLQCHLKPVRNLQTPERWDNSAVCRHVAKHLHRGWGLLILEIPGQRHRTVENETHGRPSLIRSLILRPPSVTPLLRAMMFSAAKRAFSRSKPPAAGTNRATALPRRVITISSPRSTQSSKVPSLFFASKA